MIVFDFAEIFMMNTSNAFLYLYAQYNKIIQTFPISIIKLLPNYNFKIVTYKEKVFYKSIRNVTNVKGSQRADSKARFFSTIDVSDFKWEYRK